MVTGIESLWCDYLYLIYTLSLLAELYAILLHRQCSTYDLLTLGILTLARMRDIPKTVSIREGNTTPMPKTAVSYLPLTLNMMPGPDNEVDEN
jgi:hypothetical protein